MKLYVTLAPARDNKAIWRREDAGGTGRSLTIDDATAERWLKAQAEWWSTLDEIEDAIRQSGGGQWPIVTPAK